MAPHNSDEDVLAHLGYKQVLQRSWGTFTSITVAISAMSILTSITASFTTGLYYGGPAECVWGWLGGSFCYICIGLGMAELASAYPTSGGMYYWQYELSGPRWGPLACWVTGWLNLLGQIAAVSAVAFLCADLICMMVSMSTALNGGAAYEFSAAAQLGIYGGLIVASSLVMSFGMRALTIATQLGGIFHLVGVALLVIALPAVAPKLNSAQFVFTNFDPKFGQSSGIESVFYIGVLGLLLPGYSYTGMDGPAHMSEETQGAGMGPPVAILTGIAIMFVGGFAMILALLFSMQDLDQALNGDAEGAGNAVAQILYDAFAARGWYTAGVGLQIILVLGVFFCLLATHTYVARILFCYARDKAVPLSSLWVRVHPTTRAPLFATWGIALAAFLLGLPRLGSETAFNAILSLSSITLVIIYVTPTLARITWGRSRFVPGPFHLGAWAYPVGAVGCLWAFFAAIVFCLPTELPVHADNLNYAAIAFGGTLFFSLVYFYFPRFGAYRWFKGPAREVDVQVDVEDSSWGETGAPKKAVKGGGEP